jgi:hypothetical protein
MADAPDWAAQLLARPFRPDAVANIVYRTSRAWLSARVARYVPRNRGVDEYDFVSSVLDRLYDKLQTGDFEVEQPVAWLSRTLQNLAVDESRKCLAAKRGGEATWVEEGLLDTTPTSDLDPETSIDTRWLSGKVLEFVSRDEESPHHRLAFLAWHWFRAVTQSHVEQAARPTTRARSGTTGGLMRTAEDTWNRLARLRGLFPDGVSEEIDGREALAYILRNSSPEETPTWQDKQVRETALDTLRQWVTRYARRIKTRFEEVAR